jgi:hypothetical protein
MKFLTATEVTEYLAAGFYRDWDNKKWKRFKISYSVDSDAGSLNVLAKALADVLSDPPGCLLECGCRVGLTSAPYSFPHQSRLQRLVVAGVLYVSS